MNKGEEARRWQGAGQDRGERTFPQSSLNKRDHYHKIHPDEISGSPTGKF